MAKYIPPEERDNEFDQLEFLAGEGQMDLPEYKRPKQPRDWSLTEQDMERAWKLYEEEKIDPVTHDNLFRAAVYCMLSAGDNYPNLAQMCRSLSHLRLDTPERMLADQETVIKVVRNARYPNVKTKKTIELAMFWQKSDLPERLHADISNGYDSEFELRAALANNAPGIGMKCASLLLRMAGYKNIVPVDIWMLRFLNEHGLPVRVSDFKTEQGISKSEYRGYETAFSELAKRD